jgi:hypothetical protein
VAVAEKHNKNCLVAYHHITMRTTKQIERVTTSNFQELEAAFNDLSSRLRFAVSAPSKSVNKKIIRDSFHASVEHIDFIVRICE